MNVLHLEHVDGWEGPGLKQDIAPDKCFEFKRENVRDQLFGNFTPLLNNISSKTIFNIKDCVYEQRQTEPNYTHMYVRPNPKSHFVHMSEVGQKIKLEDGAIISLKYRDKLVWMLRFEKNPTK